MEGSYKGLCLSNIGAGEDGMRGRMSEVSGCGRKSCVGGRTDRWVEHWMEGGRMEGWTVGWMGGALDGGWEDRWRNEAVRMDRVGGCVNGWVAYEWRAEDTGGLCRWKDGAWIGG